MNMFILPMSLALASVIVIGLIARSLIEAKNT